MKKYFLFLILLFTVFSCQEDVRFNNPAFQGMKDNVLWRAVQTRATVYSGGTLVIEAYTATEVVTLKNNTTAVGIYSIGTNANTTATYVYTDPATKESVTFSSGFGVGNGQIEITEYDVLAQTISGTFKFNLENTFDNPLAGATLNYQYGVFYKVPVTVQ
ncbi:30S ribosomal protein S16 [Flavobacterium daejeonense]|nr:30S ribosomal protein S16 [Flavobacterium daejeonense]